jgi:hypothetical protein
MLPLQAHSHQPFLTFRSSQHCHRRQVLHAIAARSGAAYHSLPRVERASWIAGTACAAPHT